MNNFIEFGNKLRQKFWEPAIWLPNNVTWKDIESDGQNNYARFEDLYFPLGFAIILIGVRVLLERFAFAPFGVYNGLKNSKQKAVPYNPVLEKAYLSNGMLEHKKIVGLAKRVDMSERQVERWLRLRSRKHRPTRLVKFTETCWRFAYYTFASFYGVWSLWNKKWLWNIRECWYEYPRHSITSDIWWYYMMSLSFYWSVMFTQFLDVKRKDFWQMFVHHITTILLLSFSWTCNLIRIGSLVLVVHDCADIFLESAKMANYIKAQRICDVLFVIFIIVWVITRLIIYPFWILYSSLIEAVEIVTYLPPTISLLNGLALLLLMLHLNWTYAIARIALHRLLDSTQKDIRSSSSSSYSEEEGDKATAMVNGTDSH